MVSWQLQSIPNLHRIGTRVYHDAYDVNFGSTISGFVAEAHSDYIDGSVFQNLDGAGLIYRTRSKGQVNI